MSFLFLAPWATASCNMLKVLQYLALISAFFLPWTVGGIFRYRRETDKKKLRISLAACAACVAVILLTVIFVLINK